MLNWPPKDPGATFDYRWDTPLDDGDSVTSASIQLLSGEVTILQQAQDATGVTIWLSGGTPGSCLFYAVAVTANGRKPDEYIGLQISDAPPLGTTLPLAAPGVVAPDYATFAALYPALAANLPPQAYVLLFAQAGLYLDNTAASSIGDLTARAMLLNMMVAHLAFTGGAASGGTPTGIVGRISSVAEGSVSLTADLNADGIPAFFTTSPYGLQLWMALAPYRTALYVAPAPDLVDVYPLGYLGQGFGGGWPWQP